MVTKARLRVVRYSMMLVAAICLASCDQSQIDDLLKQPTPPHQYQRGVVVGPGGKVTAARLEQWITDDDDSTTGEWKRIDVDTPIPPGAKVVNHILAGTGANDASASESAVASSTVALFSGGTESAGTFATRIAVLIEPRADTVSPYSTTSLQMTVARASHSATALGDGRVLIAGGVGATSNSINATAELFSFTTKTFTATGSMRLARYAHAAAALPGGRVLIIGGGVPQADGFLTATTEIFNVSTGTFSNGPTMAVARFNPSAVALNDGRVLVIGGNGLRSAEVYSPTSNTFTSVPDMAVNHGLGHVSLKLANGKVLVLGGSGGNAVQATAVAELFDPATNSFTMIGNMTADRLNHFAVLQDNGIVLIGGGQNAIGDVVATSETYNPFTNTFRVAPSMPLPGTERAAAFVSRTP